MHALHFYLPQRVDQSRGFGLPGRLDRLDDSVDAVVASESLGQTADVVALGLPGVHVPLRNVGIFGRLREPGREEHGMQGAVGCRARLRDELIGRVRAAGGDDAGRQPLLLGLLQDQRVLLNGGGDE